MWDSVHPADTECVPQAGREECVQSIPVNGVRCPEVTDTQKRTKSLYALTFVQTVNANQFSVDAILPII